MESLAERDRQAGRDPLQKPHRCGGCGGNDHGDRRGEDGYYNGNTRSKELYKPAIAVPPDAAPYRGGEYRPVPAPGDAEGPADLAGLYRPVAADLRSLSCSCHPRIQ